MPYIRVSITQRPYRNIQNIADPFTCYTSIIHILTKMNLINEDKVSLKTPYNFMTVAAMTLIK